MSERAESQAFAVVRNLGREPNPSLFRAIFVAGVSGTGLGMLVLGAAFWYFSRGLPRIITAADYRPATVSRVFGASGKDDAVLGEFFRERRYIVPYDKIPELLVQAFISAEDDRFFEHPGINIISMVRAGIANFKAGHVVQGGSTITQQVAKSLLLTRERSYDRKIKEVILAARIERNLTKQQILYLYLNQIYLGHGSYGVQAAAKNYFRKDVADLTLAEAAMLAGMPQAPGIYSPLLNPKKAKDRQLYVLRRMLENKYISQAQMQEAAALPLKVYEDEIQNGKAAYLVEQIRRYLVEKYGEKAVLDEGLSVITPSTPELSLAAHKAMQDGLLALDKRLGYRGAIKNLKTTEEIEKFLKDQRLKMIKRKLQYQLFLPDGRIDPIEAMRFENIENDFQLLDTTQMHLAVVTGFDNKLKTARVMIGAIRAELPLENMKWARPVRDEKNPNAFRPEPTLPSRVFKKGDVIQVRFVKNETREGVEETIVALEQDPEVQGALVSMEVQTGFVLAMEGGFDFGQSEFNRAVQAMRQPGSAFKPMIYAAAVEKGFTPASIITDSPIVFKEADGMGSWKPNNFEEKFYGDTTFRQALIKSRNIPTIKIVQAVNVPYIIEYAKRLGMQAQFQADLSISLGTASVSLLELTRAYALFPRLGRRVLPIYIQKVIDRDGRVLEEQAPQVLPSTIKIPSPTPVSAAVASTPAATPSGDASPTPTPVQTPNIKIKVQLPTYPLAEDPDQVLDPRVAYVMTHLMKGVVLSGTAHNAKSLGRTIAGKTGTTNDSIDAWFMGFSPHVATGVWVGYDTQKTMGLSETGAHAALPIWMDFMREAVKPYPDIDFTIPPGVVFASIDSATGKLVPPNSPSAVKEAFIEGTEPVEGEQRDQPGSTENQSDFFKEDLE